MVMEEADSTTELSRFHFAPSKKKGEKKKKKEHIDKSVSARSECSAFTPPGPVTPESTLPGKGRIGQV